MTANHPVGNSACVAGIAAVADGRVLLRRVSPAHVGAGSQGIWPASSAGIGIASVPWGDAITGINRADTASENFGRLSRSVASGHWPDYSRGHVLREVVGVTAEYRDGSQSPEGIGASIIVART